MKFRVVNGFFGFFVVTGLTVGFFWGEFEGVAGAEDTSAYDLPEVVVTATRTPVSRDKIGSSISVITARQMEEKKLHNVQDALRQTAGVDILRFGGPGKSTNVQLRGASASQTMIMVDGVPIRSNTSDAAELNFLSTDNIERIEVLKGSQSTLYGSNAIGGVINIITKRGQETPEGSVTTEVGTWRSRRYGGGYRGSSGKFRYSVNASTFYTNGLSAADEYDQPQFENDYARAKYFSGRLSFPLGGFDVDATLNSTNSVTAADAGAAPTGDTVGRFSWEDFLVGGIGISRSVTENYDYRLELGYSYDLLDGLHFGAPGSAGNFSIHSHSRTVNFQNNYRTGDHTLTFGWTAEESNGKNVGRTNPFGTTYWQRSVYAQDLYDWKDWTFTIGGRYDSLKNDSGADYNTEKVGRTFRVAASHPFDQQTRFHGSFGTGFRKPSLNDLLFPSANASNTNLLPEKSKSWDGGLEYVSADQTFRIDVTYFDMIFQALISRLVVGGVSTGPPINLNRAVDKGFEIEGDYKLSPKLSLSFNATFQHTENQDRDTTLRGRELTRRPQKKATGTIRYEFNERFDAVSTVRFVGNRWNNSTNTERLSQATVTDFVFHYKQDRRQEWGLKIVNAFDEVNYETTGFSPELRNIWLTYTWRM